jgi:SAM-dependent methyltransferase
VAASDRALRSVAGCRAAYDAHAAEYARVLDPTLTSMVERLAELADARRGVRLLDLATGTGAVARAAAARGASVVGIDVSAPMLAVARELSPEIDFRSADAHALPFPDEEFDVVVCGLAVSHFHEPLRALGEVLRVLRERGRLVASTWGSGGGTPSSGTVLEVLKRYGARDKGYTLDEETWLYPERGSEVLRRAGFPNVSVDTERFAGRFLDAEQALQWTLAWPCGSARLARLDVRERDAFLAEARRALADADLSWDFVFNVYLAAKATAIT